MKKEQSGLAVRPATDEDLSRIVELLRDDVLGSKREANGPTLPGCYREAFREIGLGNDSQILVAVLDGKVVGTFQMTYWRVLAHQGARVAQIGSVRVASELRGRGLGSEMVGWAVDEARRRGCDQLQLNSDRVRIDAHRFYERLGFRTTSLGMKMVLAQS